MAIIHVSLATGGPCQVVGKQWEGAHIGVHVPPVGGGGRWSSQLLLGEDWKRRGYQTEPNTKATKTWNHGILHGAIVQTPRHVW